MLEEDIELMAITNKLDLREIYPWHFRVMDQYSKWLFDIFIKKNKNGKFMWNSVGVWSKEYKE